MPFEVGVVSAHRTPGRMLDYARGAADRGIEVIIAGAGGAAHLPGMVASATPLPVIGVPVPLAKLDGMDSLLSIVQMPAGRSGGDGVDRRGAQRRAAGGADPGGVGPGAAEDGWRTSRTISRPRCWRRIGPCGSDYSVNDRAG